MLEVPSSQTRPDSAYGIAFPCPEVFLQGSGVAVPPYGYGGAPIETSSLFGFVLRSRLVADPALVSPTPGLSSADDVVEDFGRDLRGPSLGGHRCVWDCPPVHVLDLTCSRALLV